MIEYSREFIHLCTCLNFSKAAKDLSMSQPTLSRHIVDLEKLLGFELFTRNPLALTSAGKYYLASISDIIEQVDAVVEQGRKIALDSHGTLVISMVPFDIGVYSSIVYEAVAKMRERFPNFSSEFYCSRYCTTFEAVVSGESDVGIIFDVPENLPEGISCDFLLEFPCMIWTHEDNPILKLPSPCVEDFARCKLVNSTNKRLGAFFDAEVAVLRRRGMELGHRVKEVESMADFFVSMQPDEIKITSAMGITCPYNPQVVGVAFDDLDFSFSTYIVYRDGAEKETVSEFARTCRLVAQRYEADAGSYSMATRN